jgi:predicted LPLAT superfamily acyltransferase
MSHAWTGMAERGSLLGMWVTARVYRLFGPRLTRYFILPIVAYFFATDRRRRRASRHYLQRLHAFPGGAAALGHVPAHRDGFRHYHKDSSRDLQSNCVISFCFRLNLILIVKFDVTRNLEIFWKLNKAQKPS